jgi:hypothetical protein
MSKNRGKSKLSKNVLFNANKHVFHCEKSLGTFFYKQPSYKEPAIISGTGAEICTKFDAVPLSNILRNCIRPDT